MRKLSTLLFLIILIGTTNLNAQENAFIIDATENLKTLDLSDAGLVTVGGISEKFGGMDFGPNDVLYGLDFNTNNFYSVDTSDASTTLIGTSNPPSTHEWSGMAYDAAEGIMYAIASFWNSSDGSSILYTIDVSDGSITEIGSQSTARGIKAIGIDDEGQMYGLNLAITQCNICLIDKTDGSVSLFNALDEFTGGGSEGYGMDFNSEDQTMYLNAYIPASWINRLYTIDLNDGSLQLVGLLADVTYALAIVSPFKSDFSADETVICHGSTVNFNDESSGAQAWNWSFEGGSPSTSTDQNPSVSYADGGLYDVELTITDPDGDEITELKQEFITVLETPAQADIPTGDEGVCTGGLYSYSINEVIYAQSYEWELEPEEAGMLEPNENEASFEVNSDWTGDFTIRVRATNICGDGEWSEYFEGTVYQSPEEFVVEGGGSYCFNGDGVEVTLGGSQVDIEYELYLDSDPTGNVVSGTGDEISFGLQTNEGYYSVVGSNEYCDQQMIDQVNVEILYTPTEPGTPEGPEVVCADEISDYEAEGTEDADTYDWILVPEEAGLLSTNGLEVSIDWNDEFAGAAMLRVYGINDCGDGNPSDSLDIEVNGIPNPAIDGDTLVCDNQSVQYAVPENDGSIFTWTVDGGTITDGEGTYIITVMWGDAGMGSVAVEEMTESGCLGTSETFDVTIDDCTNINESLINNTAVVYPNPTVDNINIEFNKNVETSVKYVVHDRFGKIVFEKQENTKFGKNSINFSIANLTTGIYFLSVISDSQILIRKNFIKLN